MAPRDQARVEMQDEAGRVTGHFKPSVDGSNDGLTCVEPCQLAESGWKYTPTPDSDDMTTCTYCGLAMDGWEAEDKPM